MPPPRPRVRTTRPLKSAKRDKPSQSTKPTTEDDGAPYQRVYSSSTARRTARNSLVLGDENELGDWTTLQCALINADWHSVDGRNKNGLDPLMKYWIRPDVHLQGYHQVRTQQIFEGDQALRDFLKIHPECMPEEVRAPKRNYMALFS
eukprot:TRINITY_DN1367_c0_g1_i9.p1 TRINITY_DN1367_c0_g1~~TRINITY_DN1367_c0_g1_i9.p1  ORF type:complete len:148 (-),score=24.06 TRINITY_DN1367_c0_g1_i9:319-762(-)